MTNEAAQCLKNEVRRIPKVSIIVPVYNTGAFLHRCVESILAQTFTDFELFLVDDGSTDDSPAICDAYAARDCRVRVLHQKNQGQSVARNNAIRQMSGQWVMFCDSDDWIHRESLQRLYDAAMDHGTRISIASYAQTTGEDPVILPQQLHAELWTPKDFYMQHFINATLPVMKLIHRDALGDLRFPVGKYIDDEYIMYRILFTQEKLTVIPAPFYAYYINETSLTKRPWNPGRLDAWQAYEEQIAFFEALGDRELVYFRYRGYFDNATDSYQEALKAGDTRELKQVRKQMRRHIRRLIRRMWKKQTIAFWMDYDQLQLFYPVYTRLYRLWLDIQK